MEHSFGTVSVIGLGYIGLPTATMFASRGKHVIGVDVSQPAVDAINQGRAHIIEPGLDEIVRTVVSSGSLRAVMNPEPADAFIVAVPTPVDHVTHVPDTSYVEAAGRSIAPVLRAGNLIVLESTSPVGTTRQLAQVMAKLRPDLRFPLDGETAPDIYLAYCPERIIPGQMLRELVENDRIIGGMSGECTKRATALYATFVKGQCLQADDRTAELCKLTENAFRDVNIAFANELSMVCDDIGIDAWKVIELANHHPRVSILNPGAGVGGHCIAVDPWFIVASSPERARLMRTAREVNDSKPEYILAKVARILEHNPGARIACLGLAYKPDVDDFRESPALEIALRLNTQYPENVVIADPFAFALSAIKDSRVGQLRVESAEEAINGADVVLMLVGHSAFRSLSRPQGVELIDAVGFWR
ncbi:hypothetical protein ASD68_15475 [Rhodanobacter sp. Root627]|nr:hypothetical protein ASD68_15475 [Rhodanobacter sp. Root627]